jgi:hypothetical protein
MAALEPDPVILARPRSRVTHGKTHPVRPIKDEHTRQKKKRARKRHARWQHKHTTTEPRWRDPNSVLTLREWAALASVTEQTAKEILKSGSGPPVVQMSPRRVGIRYADHCAWLERCVREQPRGA